MFNIVKLAIKYFMVMLYTYLLLYSFYVENFGLTKILLIGGIGMMYGYNKSREKRIQNEKKVNGTQ